MRILCVLLLVLPLLFPGSCAEGVRRGLALAAGSALPALFPFFVAGELLTASHADRALSRLLAPLLRRIYALPQAGAAPVVLGLTGGYPVGAAVCASLLRGGRLSASDARREALFCSCASPGFCIALAGVTLFGSAKTGALLYGIQAVSALLTGIFVSRGTTNGQTIPVSSEPSDSRPFSVAFCSAVRHAAAVSLDVTAFLVTFSVVLTLMEPVFSRAPALRLLSGLLELTSGLAALSGAFLPKSTLFVLVSFLLAFGGASVLMQMQAVAAANSLTLPGLVRAKLLHGALAAALSAALCRAFPSCVPAFVSARPVSSPSAVSAGVLAAVTVLYIFYSGKKRDDTL